MFSNKLFMEDNSTQNAIDKSKSLPGRAGAAAFEPLKPPPGAEKLRASSTLRAPPSGGMSSGGGSSSKIATSVPRPKPGQVGECALFVDSCIFPLTFYTIFI